MKKQRLDQLLVDRHLVETRSQARSLILAGEVLVNEQVVDKPGTHILSDAVLRVRTPPRYVSRGGIKLEAALHEFRFDVNGAICADIGASTGGFTDCLLQHGAKKIYAIDVGYGQMHWRLQTDIRVVRMDRENFRYFDVTRVSDPIDFLVADVSFISLSEIIPNIFSLLRQRPCSFSGVLLIKPQFEVGRVYIEKGGIVRDVAAANRAVLRIENLLHQEAVEVRTVKSPLKGADGNQEYLCGFRLV